VDQKQIVARLLAKANKYRDFARWVADRETVQGILALTDSEPALWQSPTKKRSERAPGKSGKKTTGPPGGI
jgi:hypothetical protein